MHGIKRNKFSQEAVAARKEKESIEIKQYLELESSVLQRKAERDWSENAFNQTTTLLLRNPEYYTIWNYRRNIFLNHMFPSSEPAVALERIDTELGFTMGQLRSHPKVYWIWNHRRWCLEHVPATPQEIDASGLLWRVQRWDKELAVVEHMLDKDARNFHAWNYRRYVLSSHPVSRTASDELVYTREKIRSNFSNFSAWHHRSKFSGDLTSSQEWQNSGRGAII